MMIKLIYFAFVCSISVTAIEYSKKNEGYVNGFSNDCSELIEPHIKPSRLKRLIISVMGPRNSMRDTLTPYSYYSIRDLAKDPEVDFTKKTFMFVGGYVEKGLLPFAKNIGHLYKNLGYNILILDSSEFTNRKSHALYVNYVRPIGQRAAEMLANLTTLGLDPKKLELVGHSIGGHTMGFIAKNYRQITGRNISTLTALDPAGPCFRHQSPEGRLDASDADFVITVATNIDGYGIATPVGHVTFYVNGGEYQTADIIFGHFSFILCTVECSHVKSIHYWISALINPGTFIGVKCDTIQQAREGDCFHTKPMVTNTMDMYVDRTKPGVYFLRTLNNYPYGIGKKGLIRRYDPVANTLGWMNRADELLAR